jgi:hypothetical protein
MLKLLTNRLYMGVMVWKGQVHEGKYTPIISADLFQEVQKALKEGVREFVLKNLKYKGFSRIFQILILFFQRQSE